MDQGEQMALARPLTRRQHECVELVTEGLSSKEIARKLGISPSTVDNHIAKVMHLYGVPSRGQLRHLRIPADGPGPREEEQLIVQLDHRSAPPEVPGGETPSASPGNMDRILGRVEMISAVSYAILVVLVLLGLVLLAGVLALVLS